MGGFRERGWREADGLLVCTEVSFDPISGMASTVDQWDEGGERQELHHTVRLYTPTELTAMLRAAGLEPGRLLWRSRRQGTDARELAHGSHRGREAA